MSVIFLLRKIIHTSQIGYVIDCCHSWFISVLLRIFILCRILCELINLHWHIYMLIKVVDRLLQGIWAQINYEEISVWSETIMLRTKPLLLYFSLFSVLILLPQISSGAQKLLFKLSSLGFRPKWLFTLLLHLLVWCKGSWGI